MKPEHIAIIMDGNGRWAKSRGLPRSLGHRAGVAALKRVVEAAPQLGVQRLTVFGFSTENWRRPAGEVSELMKLLKTKTVLVGAIDIASERIDTPEEVAATLKLATRFVDPERIQACTNCGMAPMTLATAYGKLRALAEGAALARRSL